MVINFPRQYRVSYIIVPWSTIRTFIHRTLSNILWDKHALTMVKEKYVDINSFDSVVTHIFLTFWYVHHPGFHGVLIIKWFMRPIKSWSELLLYSGRLLLVCDTSFLYLPKSQNNTILLHTYPRFCARILFSSASFRNGYSIQSSEPIKRVE